MLKPFLAGGRTQRVQGRGRAPCGHSADFRVFSALIYGAVTVPEEGTRRTHGRSGRGGSEPCPQAWTHTLCLFSGALGGGFRQWLSDLCNALSGLTAPCSFGGAARLTLSGSGGCPSQNRPPWAPEACTQPRACQTQHPPPNRCPGPGLVAWQDIQGPPWTCRRRGSSPLWDLEAGPPCRPWGVVARTPSSRQQKESHLQKENTRLSLGRNADREGREMGTPVQGSQQIPLSFKLF